MSIVKFKSSRTLQWFRANVRQPGGKLRVLRAMNFVLLRNGMIVASDGYSLVHAPAQKVLESPSAADGLYEMGSSQLEGGLTPASTEVEEYPDFSDLFEENRRSEKSEVTGIKHFFSTAVIVLEHGTFLDLERVVQATKYGPGGGVEFYESANGGTVRLSWAKPQEAGAFLMPLDMPE